jgi:hypothetical protein
MPIGGPSTYLSTIDEFLAHWTLVDAALGSNLQLSGGYKRSNLVTDRATMVTKVTAATTAIDDALGAGGDRNTKRAAIKEKMRQFNQTVRGLIIQEKYHDMLPEIPVIGAAQGPWTSALDKMTNAWTHINTDSPAPTGFTPPLVLSGTYNLAGYATDKTAMLAAFSAYTTAAENQESAITDRDATMEPIRQRLIQYRLAVQGAFPAGNSLIASLPAVSPKPGSTPKAAKLTAVWDAGLVAAHCTWADPVDAKITGFQVRGCFGTSSYRTQDESVIGDIGLGVGVFDTDEGLGSSSSFVWLKVYSLTATGNEKGSNAVKVLRP